MKKYLVTLTPEERDTLEQLISSGRSAARTLTHARILLKADQGAGQVGWTDEAISQALEVSRATVERVRRRLVEEGVEAALHRRAQAHHRPRALDGSQEAHLIALACGEPPPGRARWTLRLLTDRMVELKYVEKVSHETLRQVLKKTNSSHG